MERTLRIGLTLALAITVIGLTTPRRAVAQDDPQAAAAVYKYPMPITKENPYREKLEAAKKRLNETIQQFWQDYYANPWNFNLQIKNYYAYVDAYYAYHRVLRLYWSWELENRRSFSGKVLVQNFPIAIPMNAPAGSGQTDPAQAANTSVVRPIMAEQPVAGAEVSLEPNIYYILNANTAGGSATGANPAGGSIVDPGKPTAKYTRTTGPNGGFAFRNIPQGSYRYTATKTGYSPSYGTVEIGTAPVTQNIYLNQTQSLAGTVFTISRRALPIIQPMLLKAAAPVSGAASSSAAGAPAPQATSASSEEVEQLLAKCIDLPQPDRRLIPVSGAQVSVSRNDLAYPMAAAGSTDQSSGGVPTPATTAPVAAGGNGAMMYPPPTWGQETTTTGGNGHFAFKSLPGSSYWMTVSHPGYLTFGGSVTLQNGRQFKRVILIPAFDGPGPVPVPLTTGAEKQGEPSGNSVDNPFNN